MKKSKLLNKFFHNAHNPTYKLLTEKDYRLIFYIIMKYIHKHKIKYTYDILCNDKENNLNIKKKNKNRNKYYNKILYIYLYFLLTLKCYMNIYKMDQINFLIIIKIFLIMCDMTTFENFLLINKNKKLMDDNILYINSLINNYFFFDSYKNNIKEFNGKDNNIIFPMEKGICMDMYIMKDNNLLIYNLNYYKLVKKFYNIFKNDKILKIYFFFDCRKISHTLLNLSSIFYNLQFLNNQQFVKYIYDKEGILLSPKNIYDISKFVIFYGNCMLKKSKIFEFLTSSFGKNVSIQKNDLIKDAYVFLIRGE